eukprot:14647160-Ditylum_brightwellii.AAC.1
MTIKAENYQEIFHNHQNSGREQLGEHIAKAIVNEATGRTLEYRDLIKHNTYKESWAKLFANKLGRLAQGLPRGIK